jgi:hypothetical protein
MPCVALGDVSTGWESVVIEAEKHTARMMVERFEQLSGKGKLANGIRANHSACTEADTGALRTHPFVWREDDGRYRGLGLEVGGWGHGRDKDNDARDSVGRVKYVGYGYVDVILLLRRRAKRKRGLFKRECAT